MKGLVWVAGAAILSWAVAAAVGGSRVNPELLLGMAGPLVAVCASWVVFERARRTSPGQVMALMVVGFALKLVFFGVYIAVLLRMFDLRPVPFVMSFVSYFIALYAMQALQIRRLTAPAD